MTVSYFGWRLFELEDVLPWEGPALPSVGPSPDAERWIARAAGHAVLERLVAPTSIEAFFREFWEHRPHVARGARIAIDVERVIRGAAAARDFVDPRGETALIVAHAERFGVDVAELTCALEDLFIAPVSANLFVSGVGETALPLHWDNQEVFVVQLVGRKRWRISPPLEPLAWRHRASPPSLEVASEIVTLEPGDRLFVPRGHPHVAEAEGGRSIHLSIAIHPPTSLDALRLVIDAQIAARAERGELRRFFPGMLWEGGAARIAPLAAEIAGAITDDAIAAAMRSYLARYDHEAEYLDRQREVKRRGAVGGAPAGLTADTTLVRTTGLARLDHEGTLEVRGYRIDLPPALRAAARSWVCLARGTPAEVAAGADLAEVVALGEVLVAVGLLAIEGSAHVP